MITYHGELDLTDGWLQDVSTLHRVGEVTLTFQGTGKIVTLSIPLGFDDLMVSIFLIVIVIIERNICFSLHTYTVRN